MHILYYYLDAVLFRKESVILGGRDAPSVTKVMIAGEDISLSCEILGKVLLSSDVIYHSVGKLDSALCRTYSRSVYLCVYRVYSVS